MVQGSGAEIVCFPIKRKRAENKTIIGILVYREKKEKNKKIIVKIPIIQ
tara:strand:+ start:129 stop:275 length:147 start_codon:yes stop_codon:yes gene_type:complete